MPSNLKNFSLSDFETRYGELLSILRNKELTLPPNHLRVFRWSVIQQSQFIESILLQQASEYILVTDDEAFDGKWKLADGLQRILTLAHFFGAQELGDELFEQLYAEEFQNYHDDDNCKTLTLQGCENIPELNGKTVADLTSKERLGIKRSDIKIVIKIPEKG